MTSSAHSRSGRFIPGLFVAGMSVVFVANGALIYFAARSWTGMAVEHPYEDGVGYNRALAAEARQDALGWTVEARLTRHDGDAALDVTVAGRDGRPLSGLSLKAKLERPVGQPETQRVELRPHDGGIYSAAVAALPRGQWEAEITASRGAERMLVSRRVVLP